MTKQQQLLKRALWLAFQASSPMGMGILHKGVADSMTEDSLWDAHDVAPDDLEIYTDYVFGRMMKTSFKIVDGELKVLPETPRYDYQSWAGTYSSGTELVEATFKSLQ